MSKARTLANLISDNAELADGQISVAEVVGAAPTASPTFTGTVTTADVTMNGYLTVNGAGVDVNTTIYPNGIAMEDGRAISFGTGADFELSSGGTFLDHNLKDNARHLRIINGLTEHHRFSGDGNVIFNNSGADADFRIESDTNTHAIFLDAANNRIGISDSSPSYTLDIRQNTNSADDGVNLQPNNQTQNMRYSFLGTTSTYFTEFMVDSTDSGTAGYRYFKFYEGTRDTNGELLYLGYNGTVFNEAGADRDFRVESDSNSNAFVIDAGYNSGKGAVIVGSNGAPTTGVDYNIAASMLKFSDALPVMATGAAWNFPSVPSNRQTQANRWRFQGFTLPYNGADAYRADSSYAQFVCELPNGGSGGKSNLELFEIGFNYGWNGGFYMVELYENYYTNSGYKKYIFEGGYQPSFNLFENYGNNSMSLNVLAEGTFQDGTTTVPSSATDASYTRYTVRASYSAYRGGMVVLTVPSWNELTSNAAEVDNGGKIRLLNPQ